MLTGKNILVYNNDNVSHTEEGIPCIFSNFSSEAVTLDSKSHMAWLEVLPTSTQTNVMYTQVTKNNDSF